MKIFSHPVPDARGSAISKHLLLLHNTQGLLNRIRAKHCESLLLLQQTNELLDRRSTV